MPIPPKSNPPSGSSQRPKRPVRRHDNSDLVLTPGGLRPRSLVHQLEPGQHVSTKGGRVQIIDTATGTVAKDLGDGGAYWCITNWYADGQGGPAAYRPPIQVLPGEVLQGVMTRPLQLGAGFNYKSSFVGYPAAEQLVAFRPANKPNSTASALLPSARYW